MSPTSGETPERLTAALAGRYELERELGSGGMATVYLARDLRHQRPVAVKVLRAELAALLGAERFLQEIRVTANLQHPHIVPLHDSGESAGFLYFVMPFVAGESLRDRLTREHELPIEDAVRIGREVAGALDYAHRHGVVHRDIKPENILLHDGQALVADFGIALAIQQAAGARLTQTGLSVGTPQYMSPEQATGDRTTGPASDIYSLGAVIYEMLIGEPPFHAGTVQGQVAAILTAEVPELGAQRATIPAQLELAVRKALARRPADRFRTAAEFAAALAGESPVPGSLVHGRPRRRRGGEMMLALVIVLGAVALWGWMRPRSPGGPASYDVGLPEQAPISFTASPLPALSVDPRGEFVVYVAEHDTTTLLWYRSLRDPSARPLEGTETAVAPAISPDGALIAYFANNERELRVVPVAGGSSALLAEVSTPGGLRWVAPGRLLVADVDGQTLRFFDLDGATLASRPGSRCLLPEALSPGDRIICSGSATPRLSAPQGGEAQRFRAAGDSSSEPGWLTGSDFRVAGGRYLTYLSNSGDLRAVRLDARRLSVGRAATLVSGVRRESYTGAGQYSVSSSGTLVFAPGVPAEVGRLVRRRGPAPPEPLPIEPARFLRFDVSRDGRFLAAVVQGIGQNELRLYDLRTGRWTPWARAYYIGDPYWEAGGQRLLVTVAATRGKPSVLLAGAPSDTRRDTVVRSAFTPYGALPSGALFGWEPATLRASVLEGAASDRQLKEIAAGVYFPSISPDGRWLVYQLASTGDLILESYPDRARRHQVAAGGWEAQWLSASELVYWVGSSWYRVRVGSAGESPVAAPVLWFTDPRFNDTLGQSYALTAGGEVIYLQGPERISSPYLRVVPGWLAQVEQAVTTAEREAPR